MTKSREQLRKSLLNPSEWNELLLNCAYKGDKAGVVEALDHGADVNTVNLHGETALHIAAIHGDMPLAAILIGRNADLTKKDKIGLTPAEWAANNEHKRMTEVFDRKTQRLNQSQQPPQAEPNLSSQAQASQPSQTKQASSTGSGIPDVLYNMGKFAYDTGFAIMGRAALDAGLNIGKFMYNNPDVTMMIGKEVIKSKINSGINEFKLKIWGAKKAYDIGSYLYNNWSGTTSSKSSPEVVNPSNPIKFMNKGANLEQDERGLSSNPEDGSIFYHVGDKTIPIKVSDDPSQGISQAAYNKILAQLAKLKKLDEMKDSILQKIADLRKLNKSEEEIIKEVESTTGIKLAAEDLRDPKKLDEKITEEVKGFYILEKCNEIKLRILQRMEDFRKENAHLSPEVFEAKIIEEIHTKEGIRFAPEELHNPEKFDEKIVDEAIRSEMEAGLTPEEQAQIFSFAEEHENFVKEQDFSTEDVEKGQDSPPELKPISGANYELLEAALKGNIEDIEKAMANGANINFQSKKDGHTALHLLTYNRNALEMLPRLLELGADPTIQDEQGDLPVHMACKADDVGLVYALLEKDLETINIPNTSGITALHLAAASGNPTLLTVMFELADDNAKAASENISIEKVEVAINRQNINGNSPLHVAVISNNPENVRLLYAHHADVNLVDEFGETALHIALSSKDQEIKDIAILSDLIPTDKKVLNSKDTQGNTLLHLAAKYAATSGDISIYNKLQENGANPLIANDEGLSSQQIIMNYAINADKRRGETDQIEDGKTKRQLEDLLPVCIALGDDSLIRKALASGNKKEDFDEQVLLNALDSGDRSKLEKIKQKASEYFTPSAGVQSSAIVVKAGNETQHGAR